MVGRASLKHDEVWKQDPPAKGFDKTVTSYAGCFLLDPQSFRLCGSCSEIVSASGFESSKLFIHYQVVVPQGWNLRTGNVVDGVAEEDLKSAIKKGTSEQRRMAQQALENDGFEDGDEALGALHGVTQCALSREWKLGHPYSSFLPRRYRFSVRGCPSDTDWLCRLWTAIPFTFDEGTRIVLGLSFFLVTIISVILVTAEVSPYTLPLYNFVIRGQAIHFG